MIPARLQPVLDEVRPLADAFVARGKRLYLVGGIVRDQLLGKELGPDADLDFTTDALPGETKAIVGPLADALWTQGERFGTIGAKLGGRVVEITTHRAEAYRPDSRKPDVQYADEIDADLSRRDFTVNAMALALPNPLLIDPYGGAADLASGTLRTPLSPDVSFTDDPLRMMRAARFIAGYGLAPVPEVVDAVKRLSERIEIVSAERVRDELDKLLVVDEPSAGLWFLVDSGLADFVLPELPAMRLEQDPIHHHKDVLAHTIAVVAKTRADKVVRLAALLHDVGKPRTRAFGAKGVSFHHHEVVGARMAKQRLRALRYANDDVDAVSQLVYLHLRFHTYRMGWTDSAVRRFVSDAGPHLEDLIELTRCDCTTRNEKKVRALERRMDELVARIDELREREELSKIRPDIDGQAVMDHLGIPPGRVVGEAMAFLLELRLEEGPLGAGRSVAAARRVVGRTPGELMFVGVDWSGDRRVADRPHRKLWWAEADDAGTLVRLEPSSRRAVRDQLLARRDERGLVVGIDAGFGYPGWFVEALGCHDGVGLWCRAADVAAWVDHRRGPFWGWAGSRRPTDVELFRHSELAARAAGWSVHSVFQLGGPGSVGTGTVTVLPLLAAVAGAGWSVWPFQRGRPGAPVLAEVYPRSFTPGVVKSQADARAAHLNARWPTLDPVLRRRAVDSDDAFDAAVTALGMVGATPDWSAVEPSGPTEGQIWFPHHRSVPVR